MSKIQWTEKTWNPIIGCSKVSEGCDNCYAEKMAARLAFNPNAPEEYKKVIAICKHWNGRTKLVESALNKPWKRKKPTIYFVGSMTDLFHESTPFEWLDSMFEVMALNQHHRFIILTKRPERMQEYLTIHCKHEDIINEDGSITGTVGVPLPLPNVLLGVTAENQEQADKRIPILLDTPAAARFVSVEPMLGAVDLQWCLDPATRWCSLCGSNTSGEIECSVCEKDTVRGNLDWVICGGESGPGARPMHPDWARGLRDQCTEAGVPFFFKQWGAYAPDGQILPSGEVLTVGPIDEKWDIFEDGQRAYRVGKHKAGNLLDGEVWEQRPEILEGQNA